MTEFEMLDAFLMKCQEGLNLEVMLEAQYEACKHIQQSKGETAADFAARAEGIMSLFEAAARDSGGKSGSNPVGFSNWGKTQKAGSKGKVGKHYGELTELLRTRATQGATR